MNINENSKETNKNNGYVLDFSFLKTLDVVLLRNMKDLFLSTDFFWSSDQSKLSASSADDEEKGGSMIAASEATWPILTEPAEKDLNLESIAEKGPLEEAMM
jgi:hypothetical protein